MRRINIILSVILICFGSYYAYLAANLPERNLPHTLGSDFMPWVLVGCLFLLSILLLIKTIFRGTQEKCDYNISLREGFGVIFLAASVFGYVKLMSLFGFLIVTPFFLAMLIVITGSRRWKEVVIVSIVATFGIYYFFQKIFQVILPAGNIF